MKTQFLKTTLSFSLLFVSILAYSQPPMGGHGKFDREKAKTLKVGIYTRVLGLTTDEAQDFWPVFNEFETKMELIRDEQHTIREEIEENFSAFSDKEIERRTDRMMALRMKEAELHSEYYEKYKKVLPIKKVALIHRAEMMYKRALLDKMREHRNSPDKR